MDDKSMDDERDELTSWQVVRKWIKTRMMRLTQWIWKLILKIRWCISKWATCDFQGDNCRTRKGDNRWGAGTARGCREI